MSYLLDALKKSEQNKEQSLPEPLQQSNMVYYPEEEKSGFDWFKVFALVTILVLSVALAFIIGKQQGQNQESKLATHSQPVVVSDVKQAAKTVLPSQVISQSEPVTNIAAKGGNTDTQIVTRHTGFSDPEKANSALLNKKKTAASPDVTQADIEGKVLTRQNTTESLASEEAVPSELQLRFERALADTMAMSDEEIAESQRNSHIKSLSNMPKDVQEAVPSLSFQTHIYSSKPEDRWLKVNNRIVEEGQIIAGDVVLEEIQPQMVIMSYQEQWFSLPALTDW
ncbi:general secretion pathway protein GspB [Catenovulum sp. SM1970]|uniref:general secretion pathway protein GspB n=1 Tax=Marinifaba aquimaris TaxID=2741323 RepID=UPI0015747565|nr:general secretion pathway protein GspB [Marinifaba aquimaris]NTS78159.1 general secretion pathway protein GspB [Marinifaba aquimaris]